jgi:hypothetical protein
MLRDGLPALLSMNGSEFNNEKALNLTDMGLGPKPSG